MAADMLIDSSQLDSSLASIADAIREKGGTSEELIFPNDFVTAIQNIPREDAIYGTFIPVSYLRSIALSDCIGKNNIFIYPMFDLVAEGISGRIHWGALIVNGRSVLQGSSNIAKSAYVMTATAFSESGWVNNADTYDLLTGTVTITATVDENYGGSFVAGKTYGYLAW